MDERSLAGMLEERRRDGSSGGQEAGDEVSSDDRSSVLHTRSSWQKELWGSVATTAQVYKMLLEYFYDYPDYCTQIERSGSVWYMSGALPSLSHIRRARFIYE